MKKKYIVNEIFYTIQGEGANSGCAAVFCRFSRCNLWTGREEDRSTAICKFCDTDFSAGEKYDLDTLSLAIDVAWGGGGHQKMVVFTGGEPGLQLDQELVDAVRDRGFFTAVESNGTVPLPRVDWLCVSPKAGTRLCESLDIDEVKLVFPQLGLTPDDVDGMGLSARYMWLSPMDGPRLSENIRDAISYVMRDSRWRLNIQMHKFVGLK